MFRLWFIASLLLSFPSLAAADGEILKLMTASDHERLDQFDAIRESALAEAQANAPAKDMAVVDRLTQQPPLSFAGFDMTGDWQCRTIKIGGLASLVIYNWFRCRVTDDGSGWALEKLSGSQRTKGRFFTESDTRLTYLGSYFVAGERAPAYGTGPDTDQAGFAYRSGSQAWRIEFPSPARESSLDILEFKRD